MIDICQILLLAVITSLVSTGVYMITDSEGVLIFSWVGKWYQKNVYKPLGKRYENYLLKRKEKFAKLSKDKNLKDYMKNETEYVNRYYWLVNPLFYCPYCMSSFWSILVYTIFDHYSLITFIALPLQMFCTLTFNALLFKKLYPNV